MGSGRSWPRPPPPPWKWSHTGPWGGRNASPGMPPRLERGCLAPEMRSTGAPPKLLAKWPIAAAVLLLNPPTSIIRQACSSRSTAERNRLIKPQAPILHTVLAPISDSNQQTPVGASSIENPVFFSPIALYLKPWVHGEVGKSAHSGSFEQVHLCLQPCESSQIGTGPVHYHRFAAIAIG